MAYNLKKFFPKANICIVEKENNIGYHASGRNSGVLHAGFYYSPHSLKAKFTKDGNLELKSYCESRGLKIKKSGKVVVAKSEEELEILYELKRRGDSNGVETYLITEKDLKEIEPIAKTYKYALWSPNTAVVDPSEILQSLKNDLLKQGVNFYFGAGYKKRISSHSIVAGNYVFEFNKLINCAGLYADKIAKDFGLGYEYILMPFKGIYLEYTRDDPFIRTNIYPVPNIKTPFLGVHFTLKVNGTIKIGPTAMPCFWRENYAGLKYFDLRELLEILPNLIFLMMKNRVVRENALPELKKYLKINLIKEASNLVECIPKNHFWDWGKTGIRAQLVSLNTFELVNDFIIESNKESLHILNAVSPAFTASLPFTRFIIKNYL